MSAQNCHFPRFLYLIPLLICLSALAACRTTGPQISPPDAEGTTLTMEQIDLPAVSAPASPAGKRRVAYFTSWSAYARGLEVGDIDPSLLTHINFAFANLDQNGEICVGDSWVDVEKPFEGDSWDTQGVKGHFGQLQKLKKSYPGLKILISVGGWTWSGNFSATAATESGRKAFADSAVRFLSQYGFDGLDIDWEFPVEGGNGIRHLPEDRENYTLLLKEVRSALNRLGEQDGKSYLLTIAGGPNPSFTKNTQIQEIMNYVDFINVMAYDYHGSWESVTGHNAPLYAADGLCVSDTIAAYLAAGAQPQKLNLGLAFYGRGWVNASSSADGAGHAASAPSGTGYGLGTWESSVFDYWDLDQNYVDKNGYTRYYDSVARVPYLYNGSVFISYDDPESIREKLVYASAQNLGGVMFWDFSGDKEKKLQRLLHDFDLAGRDGAPEQSPAETAPIADSTTDASHASATDASHASATDASHASATDASHAATTAASHASGAAAWEPDVIYHGGDQVVSGGVLYQAKWWTQNQDPSANCQEWGPWSIQGAD